MTTRPIVGNTSPANTKPTIPIYIIAIGLSLPTLITWVYFVALATFAPSVQQFAFSTGKLLQFALPIVAYFVWQRFEKWEQLQNSPLDSDGQESRLASSIITNGYTTGIATGIAISIAILGLYFAVLLPNGLVDNARVQAKEKLQEMGLNAPWKLFLVAAFYALLHSGFEEFYWRRFVFRGLLNHVSLRAAILVSSLGFMAHHVLVVARYFGWDSPLTYALSLGVAIGGGIWAYMLYHYRHIVPGWISHALVDAALFIIAFHLTMG